MKEIDIVTFSYHEGEEDAQFIVCEQLSQMMTDGWSIVFEHVSVYEYPLDHEKSQEPLFRHLFRLERWDPET